MNKSISWNLIFASLLPAVAQAEPIYLLPNDSHIGRAEANSINEAGIVVGWCGTRAPCYWDTNETPFTYDYVPNVSFSALRPHIFGGPDLPYPPNQVSQSSMLLDIDDAGMVLGFPGYEQFADGLRGPFYYTAQLPGFTGWTLFPSVDCSIFGCPYTERPPSDWTHTPTLSNANWIVTNETPNPVEGPSIPQLNPSHFATIPEPGTLGAVLIGLALLARRALVWKQRRRR